MHQVRSDVDRVTMTETRYGDISDGLAPADRRKSQLLACCRDASSCSRTHGIAGLSTAALALNTTEFAQGPKPSGIRETVLATAADSLEKCSEKPGGLATGQRSCRSSIGA